MRVQPWFRLGEEPPEVPRHPPCRRQRLTRLAHGALVGLVSVGIVSMRRNKYKHMPKHISVRRNMYTLTDLIPHEFLLCGRPAELRRHRLMHMYQNNTNTQEIPTHSYTLTRFHTLIHTYTYTLPVHSPAPCPATRRQRRSKLTSARDRCTTGGCSGGGDVCMHAYISLYFSFCTLRQLIHIL